MKTITIQAGERKKIISVLSNSIPADYPFRAECDKEKKLTGKIEVCGSQWLLPKPPILYDLKTDNLVHKGAWDSIYRVYVAPDVDVTISLPGFQPRKKWLYFLLLTISAIIGIAMATILFLT